MSIRFGAVFDQSEAFWHGIQVECDFRALASLSPEGRGVIDVLMGKYGKG